MTKETALGILENMPDDEFNEFLNNLPMRTQLCVKGGLVNWKDVLPDWYIKGVK